MISTTLSERTFCILPGLWCADTRSIRLACIFLFLTFHFSLFTSAQSPSSWQELFWLVVDDEASVDDDSGEWTEDDYQMLFEHLSELTASPLNLNTVTPEQLSELLFLTDRQVEDIYTYVDRYGPVRSLGELQMIRSLGYNERRLLSYFVYAGEADWRQRRADYYTAMGVNVDSLSRIAEREINAFSRPLYRGDSRGEVVAYTDIPLYTRRGFEEGQYNGANVKHWLRTSFKPNQHMKIGLVASQDAGEPFFEGRSKAGYDLYSGYVQLKNLRLVRGGSGGKGLMLKNLVAGNYRIRSGMGLILNTSYGFGKTFSMPSMVSSATSLTPSNSRSSAKNLLGIAASFDIGHSFQTTLFASFRPIDATLNDDGLSIRTLLSGGYHRTESELARKNNATQASAGLNAAWTHSSWHLGATAIYNRYSLPLQPVTLPLSSKSQLYRLYNPRGQEFFNASIDYAYKLGRRFSFRGETAVSNPTNPSGSLSGGGSLSSCFATINALSWRTGSTLTLTAIQRFYPYRFAATMGRSFAEGGQNQNESGVYVGAAWTPNGHWNITAYTDIAYFPWYKYLAQGSTHSFDNHLQATFKIDEHQTLMLRYRGKWREKDADKEADGYKEGDLLYRNDQRLRLGYVYRRNHLTAKVQGDFSYCRYKNTDIGAMATTSLTYDWKRWKWSGGASYFNTTGYDARVYGNEQSMAYTFSIPSFYGKGIHVYAFAQVSVMKNVDVAGKLAWTKYFDRSSIGSSYQLIKASFQTDAEIMVKWKF